MKRYLVPTLLVMVLSGSALTQEKKRIYSNSYLGKTPPELAAPKENWLNTKKKTLSLKELKGEVVWLEFSFLK